MRGKNLSDTAAAEWAADLALMQLVAAEAGDIAMRYFRRSPHIEYKGDTSPVTEADLAIDAHIHARLTAARPDYGWLSEEQADNGSRLKARRCFIVDPIDGTRAFIAETADWCISIGLVEGAHPVAGVLHCPVSKTVYAATRNGGAFRNDVRLGDGPHQTDDMPRIALSTPMARKLEAQHMAFKRVAPAASLALRLAHVADATLDATLVKPRAAFWDVAAADLILREAGGMLATPAGKALDYAAVDIKLGAMLAARPPFATALLAVVPAVLIG
jgi:myo-inositol-1(or 4)-monophosphatase